MKIKDFKEKAKGFLVEKKTQIHYWYIQNEEKIWTRGVIVLPVVATIGTAIGKSIKSAVDEHHLKLQQYDPATGYYNQLKRPLKPQDWDRIMRMKREFGLTLTECLVRLGLTK